VQGVLLARIDRLHENLKEVGMANGIALAGYGAGGALAVLLPPLLLDPLGGWRTLTSILGILTIVVGLLWLFTIRESPRWLGQRSGSS